MANDDSASRAATKTSPVTKINKTDVYNFQKLVYELEFAGRDDFGFKMVSWHNIPAKMNQSSATSTHQRASKKKKALFFSTDKAEGK